MEDEHIGAQAEILKPGGDGAYRNDSGSPALSHGERRLLHPVKIVAHLACQHGNGINDQHRDDYPYLSVSICLQRERRPLPDRSPAASSRAGHEYMNGIRWMSI